jgi:hypothetical protein
VHRGPDDLIELPIAGALKRAVSQHEIQLLAPRIALTPEDTVWHLTAHELGEVVPRAADRIVAGDIHWIVLAAMHATLQSRWRVYSRRAR